MSQNFGAYKPGQAITATGVTQLTDAAAPVAADALIDNRGSVDVVLMFGGADVAVSFGTGIRVPAGAIAAYAKGNATHVAVAVASGTPSIVIHVGEGA